MAEHRREIRKKVTTPVSVQTKDRLLQLLTMDISGGGMYVLTDSELPDGEDAAVEMLITTKDGKFKINTNGTIRRPSDMGAAIVFYGAVKIEKQEDIAYAS